MLRSRRGSGVPRQKQDESFICFCLFFQAWLGRRQLMDRKVLEESLRASGA